MDADPASAQRLLLVVHDGGYTNGTVLKRLPPRTTCIGRIRKDAHLYGAPALGAPPTRGRRRSYGPAAPTPEQVRTDSALPWQSLTVSITGATHTLRFKSLHDLMWRAAGATHTLQLIVIAPLAYRLRKGSKLLYRDPAFLICTDNHLEPEQLIQSYLLRCDIELNFREEKTLFGVGQAQVRHETSVATVPAFQVASYALLLLATARVCTSADPHARLPAPKWAARPAPGRLPTQQALHQLRAEVWGRGLGLKNFSDFANAFPPVTKSQKFDFPLESAVLYANA
jgi:hypothetical protein